MELSVTSPQPPREKPLPHETNLIFDLALLPTRSRRAGHRLDQIVRAHLLEAPVEPPLLAHEHGLHCRLHVVVDAPPRDPAEHRERPRVGVEHHLLGLARIGPDVEPAAVAQPRVRHLHRRRNPAQLDLLVAPVELVGVARREAQRHERLARRGQPAPLVLPAAGVAAHGVIRAFVALAAEKIGDPRQGQPVLLRRRRVGRQHRLQPLDEQTQLPMRLLGPLIVERGLARPQNLAHRVARQPQLPRDRPGALALRKMLSPDLRNRLHNQHPRSDRHALTMLSIWSSPTQGWGVIFGRRYPRLGGQFSTPIHTPKMGDANDPR